MNFFRGRREPFIVRAVDAAAIATVAAFAVVAALASSGCAEADATRHRLGDPAEDDSVRIAAAWSWRARKTESYARGIELAVREANEQGGVLGRPIAVHRIDDDESVHAGRLAAQGIAGSEQYAAVLGHLHSHVSSAVAQVYEAAGLLMLSPASSAPDLTQRGYRLIFRSVNSDAVTALQLADFAGEKGFGRVAVCYVRGDYGSGLANAFERAATDRGIEIVDRKSYADAGQKPEYYQEIFRDWADRQIDAVMLAGSAPGAAVVLQGLRSAGIQKPIFGGDALDDRELLDASGDAARGLTAVSVFHPENSRDEVQAFNAAYMQVHGAFPDSWAARGYDSMRLLLGAISDADGMAAEDIAAALRRPDGWRTLHGTIRFDERGDPEGLPGILIRESGGRYLFAGERPAAPIGRRSSRR